MEMLKAQQTDGNTEENENSLTDIAEEESKQESTAQKIRLARKISKISKLSEVLRRNSSIGRDERGSTDREYRLITAGEDGNIFWWSFRQSYNDDLSAIEKVDLTNPMSLFL